MTTVCHTDKAELYKACKVIADPWSDLDARFEDGQIHIKELKCMDVFELTIPCVRSPHCQHVNINPYKFNIGRNASPLNRLFEFFQDGDEILSSYMIEEVISQWSYDIVLCFYLRRNGLTLMTSSCLMTTQITEVSQ